MLEATASIGVVAITRYITLAGRLHCSVAGVNPFEATPATIDLQKWKPKSTLNVRGVTK